MKVVIDIPDEWKTRIEYNRRPNTIECGELVESIWKGKMLPKGHGRLIDADEAIKTLKSLGNRDYRREKGTIQEAEKMLSFDEYTPTIIEADKAESEEKE